MKKTFTIGVLIIIVIAGLLFWSSITKRVTPQINTASSTPSASIFDQTLSDGLVTFGYFSEEFGLAANPTQILTRSYIPPCSETFDYCLYYIGKKYEGTNFESSGLRIQKRDDLGNEKLCLNTPPGSFDSSKKPDSSKSADKYSSSVFTGIGDAGAGHYASGTLYRLFVKGNSSCYEFETRIGQTQFANYPAGAVKEFTASQTEDLRSKLTQIIENISLPTGEKYLFDTI